MTKEEEKLKKFENYVLEKAEKERRERLERQNQAIETEIAKKVHELAAVHEKKLNTEIERWLMEKNKQLQKERQDWKQKLAHLSVEKEYLAKELAKKKLKNYVKNSHYIDQLTSKLSHESDQITEFIFTSDDMMYFSRIQEVTKGRKIRFTGDFMGGYQAFVPPNIMIDHSFSRILENK